VADLLFIVILVAFFALMVAFVRLCERIVGKDEAMGTDPALADADSVVERTSNPAPEEVPA
jgi:hypothetical protein